MSDKQNRRGRPRVDEITDSQKRTLRAIRDHVARHQMPPTMQELSEQIGISSASAHEQVNQLVRKGYLRRERRKARGLVVVREPEEEISRLAAIPLVGQVKAGLPVLAEENRTGEVLVEGSIAKRGRCFALNVSGDSMKDAAICPGDVVIVRQQPVAEMGDIVVALVDGEATLKRLFIQGDRIELRPENKEYRPIVVGSDTELQILGKVVAIRSMAGE